MIPDPLRSAALNANPLVRYASAATLCAFIVVVSLTPDTSAPGDTVFVWLVQKTPSMVQNAMHVVLYGSLTVLCAWALSRRRAVAISAIFAVLLGAGLEWLQLFVPGRYGTLFDVALNAFGALLGAALASRWAAEAG